VLSVRCGNLVIFIPFCNMNLLIAFHIILQNEETLGRGPPRVENTLQEEDLDVGGWEEGSDGGREL
jgi:hypothetical protein